MYTTETVTHKDAALLVDGTIVLGSIFNGTTFVAGSWRRDEFKPEGYNQFTRTRNTLTLDITGREIESVDSMVKHIVRATRAEVK